MSTSLSVSVAVLRLVVFVSTRSASICSTYLSADATPRAAALPTVFGSASCATACSITRCVAATHAGGGPAALIDWIVSSTLANCVSSSLFSDEGTDDTGMARAGWQYTETAGLVAAVTEGSPMIYS